jgi:amidase
VKRLLRESAHYAFDATLPPALEVEPGESFWVETHDAHRGTISDESVVYTSLQEVFDRLGGANPVTGPIAVRGAAPGDCLVVSIEEIVPAPRTGQGYTCTTPTLHPSLAPETVICPIDGDAVLLRTARGAVRLPLRPMLGTLGIAAAGEPRPSFQQGADILGNVDLPALRAGARVVLRAQVAGGLLFLGDAHLAQGDAEIHRAAIETEADVRLSVEVASPEEVGFVALPQLDSDDAWGSVAPGPGHLEELVRAAYDDLAQRLVGRLGLGLADAYRLLGSAGRVTVGQVVPPLYSVLVSIPRALLPSG